ncbi:uncharacterized protein LOC141649146 [Silene latifolia]|uniref:uncharacterized protein LOC141649146 n=1 Tax=Silene latifolia TaxID=37657 RepID=UPI003D7860E6
MADRSVKFPMCVLEDVLVRVGKFFIPVDFVVIDMVEDSRFPIILGRPFLHTAGALIDVKNGSLTLSVRDDIITFKLDKASRHPELEATCNVIDIVDPTFDKCFALCLDRDPPNASVIASRPWSKEVDEIEQLIYGNEPHPKTVYSLDGG